MPLNVEYLTYFFFFLVERGTAFINGDLISSNLGKTLVLIWTIQKCKSSYVDLYFNSHDGKIISRLVSVSNNHVTKSGFAIKKIGDRINVTCIGRNFKVELKHLQNNDTDNFSVRSFGRHVSSYPSSILINETQGMYRFVSELIHYDITRFRTL